MCTENSNRNISYPTRKRILMRYSILRADGADPLELGIRRFESLMPSRVRPTTSELLPSVVDSVVHLALAGRVVISEFFSTVLVLTCLP